MELHGRIDRVFEDSAELSEPRAATSQVLYVGENKIKSHISSVLPKNALKPKLIIQYNSK